jgi:hypothetical protein
MNSEIAPGLPEAEVGNRTLFFALLLAIIIAALEATVLMSLWSTSGRSVNGAILRTSAPILIALGILIQSNFVRYLGSIWLAAMGLGSLWQLFASTSTKWGALAIVLLISSVLSVGLAAVLLGSKDFSKQFGLARSKHSRPKKTVRTCVIIVVSLGAIIATYNDVVNLTR